VPIVPPVLVAPPVPFMAPAPVVPAMLLDPPLPISPPVPVMVPPPEDPQEDNQNRTDAIANDRAAARRALRDEIMCRLSMRKKEQGYAQLSHSRIQVT
jgi:hypothetical protein